MKKKLLTFFVLALAGTGSIVNAVEAKRPCTELCTYEYFTSAALVSCEQGALNTYIKQLQEFEGKPITPETVEKLIKIKAKYDKIIKECKSYNTKVVGHLGNETTCGQCN